jgi:hypothetical protein
MRSLKTCAVLLFWAITGTAGAQSFNVDINTTSGFGAGVPSNTYAAAAGQPGTWNSILPTSPTTVPLVNLNGSASSATLTRATNGVIVNTTNLTTSGNFSLLNDDYQTIGPSNTLSYTFNNLQAGDYAVFTYAANPDNATNTSFVTVALSSSTSNQVVQGNIAGNQFIPSTTHAIHMMRSVSAGGSITINVLASSGFGAACCGGFQIVKLPTGGDFRFYVNDNATGIDAGGSWADAYTDLQNAMNSARIIGGTNSEIWVAQGTYRPGVLSADYFGVPSNLTMYGGFAGTETSLSQRTNPAVYITNLSGAIGTNNYSRNVLYMSVGTIGTVTIDGFSITRGFADGSGFQSRGGGLTVDGAADLYCRNCKFISNTSLSSGGAVAINAACRAHFINCLFFNNTCTDGPGGAVSIAGPGGSFSFVNCQFLGNDGRSDGGGLYVASQPGEIVNTIFSGNAVRSTSGKGGAVEITNGNFTVDFRQCSISHNTSAGGGPGGVYVSLGATANIYNSILWDNANSDGPGSVNDNIESVGIGSAYTTSFTTVQGLAGTNGQNPLFVDADGGNNIFGDSDDNLRLQLTSPCIDAGNTATIGVDEDDLDADGDTAEPTPLDLGLNPRRQNIASVADTGAGSAPQPDRGAYEAVPPPCPGDLNGDGQRNTADLVIFLGAFGTAGPNIPSDLNNDGFVNTLDLTQFLGQFGVPCL